jgi:hypothetical protein
LGVEDFNSPECLVQVVPVGDEVAASSVFDYVGGEVVASGVLAPVLGALFTKNLCDFLTNLEDDDLESGKTVGCLLKEREMRNKKREGGTWHPEGEIIQEQNKKGSSSRKVSTAA